MLAARAMGDETRLGDGPVASIERRRDAVVVHLVGELDLYNTPAFRDVLVQLCQEQPPRLVIDLQEVAFVDSTGLGVLIETRSLLRNRDAFVLAAPGLDVRRALEISGLDRHIAVHDTVAAAVAPSSA